MGAGRVGTTLALALANAGYHVVAVASRRAGAARTLAARLPSARAMSADALVARCSLVVLAVPDDSAEALARALPWRAEQAAVLLSGALALDTLDAVAARGGLRGCLHPLQTFPQRFGPASRFSGIYCGVEGDGTLGARLSRMTRALGARPLSLHGVDRARYHAAAVFASNYVIALHAAAEATWTLAGLPRADARRALAPLTRGAAQALSELPLARALTGPLARGDVRSVQQHLQALQPAPALHALYAALGAELLALPLSLPARRRRALRTLFSTAEPERKPARNPRKRARSGRAAGQKRARTVRGA